MSRTIQSGMHPDAETLSVFAEKAVTGVERDQILAHMAECSRCREIVFLAQRAMDAGQSTSVGDSLAEDGKKSRSWFGEWWLVWVPTAALAGFVGFAALMHMRHPAQDQQMARIENRPESITATTVGKAPNSPAMQQAPMQHAPMRDESKGTSALRETVRSPMQKDAKILDKRNSIEAKDQTMHAADAIGASAGSRGTVSGTFETRAKSSPIGGPAAQNQVQQNYARQNALVQPQSAAINAPSNKPAASSGPPSLARAGAVSESVEVTPAFQAAPAESRQLAVPSTVTAENFEVAGEKKEKLASSRIMLPSGLQALSVATAAQRSIAIDASGALFLSEDTGGPWQSVKTQWTGRAVLVRTLGIEANSALLKQQAPGFELVNDKLRSWVSTDGKTWTEKNLPEKSPEP